MGSRLFGGGRKLDYKYDVRTRQLYYNSEILSEISCNLSYIPIYFLCV